MDQESDPSHIHIRTSRVVGASLITAIGSLTTLGVVLFVRNTDVLASIALVLAIVSFVIQILFYVAQTESAAAQVRSAEQTNIQTREVLAEIRLRSSTLESAVGAQMNKVWDWLLANQPGAAKAATESILSEEQGVGARPRRRQRSAQGTGPVDMAGYLGLFPSRRREDVRILRELRQPPPGPDLERVAAVAEALDSDQRKALMHLLNDEIQYRHKNGTLGLPDQPDELERLGLTHGIESPMPDISERWHVLTDLGRLVGRYGRAHDWAVVEDAPLAGEPSEDAL